ncbi:hypothetical protein [Cupriavidus pinatubonensis]|uniref:hypothetical protein n=1 Tax=Cupriavidus pinatubonensis TaxID=248026 RepID=UPI002159D9C5|nr:hypothetical protein [Cupriavidus pinatubonensis]
MRQAIHFHQASQTIGNEGGPDEVAGCVRITRATGKRKACERNNRSVIHSGCDFASHFGPRNFETQFLVFLAIGRGCSA